MEKEKRSQRGGGTVHQRTDGRWQGQISLGHSGGRRVRKTVSGATAADVRKKLRTLQMNIDRGLPTPGTTPKLTDFMNGWLETVHQKLSANTHKTYEMLVRVHIEPEIGNVRLHKLTQHDVNALLNRKSKEASAEDATFSLTTVAQIRRILVTVLNAAMKADYVGRNVASLSETVKAERFEARALTASEAQALLEAATESPYLLMYQMAIATGMRQGELLGLRWQDVDFDNRSLRLRQQIQRVDNMLQLQELKTAKSRRTIPVPEAIVEALKHQRTEQKAHRLAAGGKWQGQHWDLVFMTATGGPIGAPAIRKDFYATVKAANLGSMRFHDLRHTATTFMAAKGMRPEEAQRILGHASIQTTLEIYTHTDLDEIRAGIERVGELLKSVVEAESA